MTHKYFKNAGLAALLSGCSLGVSRADSSTPPQSPDQLLALFGHNGTAKGPGGGAGITPKASCSTGWQPYTCAASETFWDGTNSTVWALNNDGSIFAWNTSGYLLSTNGEALINACNTGHLYFLFITSPACTWDATFNSH